MSALTASSVRLGDDLVRAIDRREQRLRKAVDAFESAVQPEDRALAAANLLSDHIIAEEQFKADLEVAANHLAARDAEHTSGGKVIRIPRRDPGGKG